MKKILLAILTKVYMTADSGIAMEIHYCMGKKAGMEFYSSNGDKCGKCGMTENKRGCCNDEHKFFKLNDFHKNVSNDLNFETPIVIILNPLPVFNFLFTDIAAESNINNHSPPIYYGSSICILNCVFRI